MIASHVVHWHNTGVAWLLLGGGSPDPPLRFSYIIPEENELGPSLLLAEGVGERSKIPTWPSVTQGERAGIISSPERTGSLSFLLSLHGHHRGVGLGCLSSAG